MVTNLLYLVDLGKVELTEGEQTDSSWVHFLAPGEYSHPVYGKMAITADRIKRFADNVKAKVRGIDASINYNHNNQDIAAGWVKDAESRDTGLWVLVEWTKAAAEKIRNKEYRYISAEYNDWEHPETKQKFTDVLFGGALTNRPFMKNLVPINLSEQTVEMALGLVDAIAASKAEIAKEGQDMDLKKLTELLGLPEGTTEEAALAKLSEALQTKAPEKPKMPVVPKPDLSQELKTLAEENPLVKALVETVENQNAALVSFQTNLMEAEISKQLSEFDKSKIVLTPRAKDLVHDFLMEAPVSLHESFWQIMGLLRNSSGLMVELGERAGTSARYGSAKDPIAMFMSEANAYAQANKVNLAEAMQEVARNNPDMWEKYRTASYAGGE